MVLRELESGTWPQLLDLLVPVSFLSFPCVLLFFTDLVLHVRCRGRGSFSKHQFSS